MSDALNYLLKVRPDAMKSYFDFIKKSSGSLDTKTKSIISVITKVDNQTEAGLKQYLKRALNEGVTADEIIDALFVAFPTLGLTKIVWAVDIILKMNLPDFDPDSLGNTSTENQTWKEVCSIKDLKEKEVTVVKADGKNLFIYKEGESIKVFDGVCPHQATELQESGLSDCQLTCPTHNWKFDVKTGECVEVGNKPLNTYDSRITDEQLEVFF